MSKTQRTISVSDIAACTDGAVLGDASRTITGLCSLDEPDPKALSFLRESSARKLLEILNTKEIGALLVNDSLAREVKEPLIPLILVPDPLKALVTVLPRLCDAPASPHKISEKVDIDPSAIIASDASIAAFSVIGPHVRIESSVVIHPHVVIYEGAQIGAGTVIHAGAVIREHVIIGPYNVIQNGAIIGADGFGYIADSSSAMELRPVPQVGIVRTAECVDIGANTCIDRATLGSTRIGTGTKIDNLVQIGHNVSLGRHNILCGQVGIAGSCSTGNNVVMGGNVGVADHIHITDDVRLGARTGVLSDIKEKGDYMGLPPLESKAWRRWYTFILRTAKKSKPTKE